MANPSPRQAELDAYWESCGYGGHDVSVRVELGDASQSEEDADLKRAKHEVERWRETIRVYGVQEARRIAMVHLGSARIIELLMGAAHED